MGRNFTLLKEVVKGERTRNEQETTTPYE